MANEPTASDVVAASVRERRKAQGLTVAQLAERCAELGMPKLTAQALYKLEGAREAKDRAPRPVTVDELIVLAHSLGVTTAVLCPQLNELPPGVTLDSSLAKVAERFNETFDDVLRMQAELKRRLELDKERGEKTIFLDPETSPITLIKQEGPEDGSH